MEELIVHEIANIARNLGILNERAYRNLCIRMDFDKMRREGVRVEEAEIILSEKYSSAKSKITPETIHSILYRR